MNAGGRTIVRPDAFGVVIFSSTVNSERNVPMEIRIQRNGSEAAAQASVDAVVGLDRPTFVANRLLDARQRTVELGEERLLGGVVHPLRLEQRPQSLQHRRLDVDQREELLLVEGRDQVGISDRGHRRLRGPESDDLVQVDTEARDHNEDDHQQDERRLQKREAELLGEQRTEDDREHSQEREELEHDPEDAHAEVPSVQPLCDPDLMTLRAHTFPRGPHSDGTDISRAAPRGAGSGREEGKKGAGVDESGGPRDGMGEDESPPAGMLRRNVERSGMGRVRRLQSGYKENRFFQSVGLQRGEHEKTEARYFLPNLWGGRT